MKLSKEIVARLFAELGRQRIEIGKDALRLARENLIRRGQLYPRAFKNKGSGMAKRREARIEAKANARKARREAGAVKAAALRGAS